jgi:serine/threonine-protein kinase RsbW/sigma-B regulation protein RsbU (phosphoserine phosphatase)
MNSIDPRSGEKELLLDYSMPSQVVMFGALAVNVEDAIADRPDLAFSTNLCLEELITNTIQYGLQNAPDHLIQIRISRTPDWLEIVLKDDAPAFNPFEIAPHPDLDASIEERSVGGLGVHLVRTLMDDAWASYDGTGNLITLKKTLKQ